MPFISLLLFVDDSVQLMSVRDTCLFAKMLVRFNVMRDHHSVGLRSRYTNRMRFKSRFGAAGLFAATEMQALSLLHGTTSFMLGIIPMSVMARLSDDVECTMPVFSLNADIAHNALAMRQLTCDIQGELRRDD